MKIYIHILFCSLVHSQYKSSHSFNWPRYNSSEGLQSLESHPSLIVVWSLPYNTYCTCNPVRLPSVESTQHVSWYKCSLARLQCSPKKQLIILVHCPNLPYIVSTSTVQLALAVKKSVYCTWNVPEITVQWDSKNRRKGIQYLYN